MTKNNYSQIHASLDSKSFGFVTEVKEVFSHTIQNSNGMELTAIDFGATISSLKIPLPNGEKIDVVLGFEKLEDYVNSFHLPSAPYFGTVVGRYAGRINKGKFSMIDKNFQLEQNSGGNHLHGGKKGMSKAVWKMIKKESNLLCFEHTSFASDDNYPGNLKVQATYLLTENNELKVTFLATSTEDTIINLTQHSYFNLEGSSNNVLDHQLKLNSNLILDTNDELIPTGNFISLENHPFNFKEFKKCPEKIDTTFVSKTNEVGSLLSEKSNLKMTVYSNQPAVHIYVGGNCFNEIKGKNNIDYNTKSGICFENQNFPDAPNHSHFPCATLYKNEKYFHQTLFKFENI
jgi:aldose 1-epimerase